MFFRNVATFVSHMIYQRKHPIFYIDVPETCGRVLYVASSFQGAWHLQLSLPTSVTLFARSSHRKAVWFSRQTTTHFHSNLTLAGKFTVTIHFPEFSGLSSVGFKAQFCSQLANMVLNMCRLLHNHTQQFKMHFFFFRILLYVFRFKL